MEHITRKEMISHLQACVHNSIGSRYVNISRFMIDEVLEHLKQPTLPKEPTDEMLRCLYSGNSDEMKHHYNWDDVRPELLKRYNSLYNHLTILSKPKTKKIKVWRVEWYDREDSVPCAMVYTKYELADNKLKRLHQDDDSVKGRYTTINIIEGEQEVPA